MKHTEMITIDKLWTSGVMDLTAPRVLQNAAFYIVGMMLSLHGGVDHN